MILQIVWLFVTLPASPPAHAPHAPVSQLSKPFHYACTMPTTPEMASHCEAIEANRIAAEANLISKTSASTDRWLAFAGVLSGLLSIAGVAVAAAALRDSRRSADAAIKALYEGRALILPGRTRITYSMTRERDGTYSNFTVTGTIDWKNYGARPALHVGFEGGVMLVPAGSKPPRMPKVRLGGDWTSLGAGDERKVETRPLHEMLLPTLLSENVGDMYLVGLVSYRDRLEPEKIRFEQITMLADKFSIPDVEPGTSMEASPTLSAVEFLTKDNSIDARFKRWRAERKQRQEHLRLMRDVRKMIS